MRICLPCCQFPSCLIFASEALMKVHACDACHGRFTSNLPSPLMTFLFIAGPLPGAVLWFLTLQDIFSSKSMTALVAYLIAVASGVIAVVLVRAFVKRERDIAGKICPSCGGALKSSDWTFVDTGRVPTLGEMICLVTPAFGPTLLAAISFGIKHWMN